MYEHFQAEEKNGCLRRSWRDQYPWRQNGPQISLYPADIYGGGGDDDDDDDYYYYYYFIFTC